MFSHAANMGHLHALFNVAMMHLNGFGTQRNCHLASTYLKFVVERGPIGQMMHAGFSRWMAGDQESSLSHYITAGVAGLEIAQVNVAEILTTKQEWTVALEWWHRASASQNVEAKLRLADAYYHGLGCPRDPAAAAVMYRSAADSKNVEAMVALGMLHHHGDVGVVQDHSLALKWYESAIASASTASAMPARVLIMVLHLQHWWAETQPSIDRALVTFERYFGIALPRSEAWPPFVAVNWDLLLIAALSLLFLHICHQIRSELTRAR